MSKKALLVLNIGTPNSVQPRAVGKYLRQFLMDPKVIDLPFVFRWLLVNLIIVPFRKKKSAEAYRQIWTDQGSPLWVNTQRFCERLQSHLPEVKVIPAMRYGEPSIESAMSQIQSEGIEEVQLLPLYPQYAPATTDSSVEEVNRVSRGMNLKIQVLPPFYEEPFFIEPMARLLIQALETQNARQVLLSFHGLPERQIRKRDPRGGCLSQDCCEGQTPSHCYRAQCYATARAIQKHLPQGVALQVGFQSRLGRTPWIRPYSDEWIEANAQGEVKRLVVGCPAFVLDCLETLEEVGIRYKELFLSCGGESFDLVPCLNDDLEWVRGLAHWISSQKQGQTSKTLQDVTPN